MIKKFVVRRKVVMTCCLLFLAVMSVFYIKDLYGAHQYEIYDIHSHYLVAKSIAQKHAFIRYARNDGMYVPPFMHIATAGYSSINTIGKPGGFDFYTYRDYSFILWQAVFGLYAVVIFLLIYVLSRKSIPLITTALLSFVLVATNDNYNLFRWFGFLQFLGLLVMALVLLYFARIRTTKKTPSIIFLSALFLFISLNHYTTALFVMVALGGASLISAIKYRKRLKDFFDAVFSRILIAGLVATAIAFALFYHLLFTGARGSWAHNVNGPHRFTDYFSLDLPIILHRLTPDITAVLICAVAVAAFWAHKKNVKEDSVTAWQAFASYFIGSSIAIIFLMNIVAVMITPHTIQTSQGPTTGTQTLFGLLFMRSSLFLPLAIAVLIAQLLYYVARYKKDYLKNKYIIASLTVGLFLFAIWQIHSLYTSFYSTNPAYPLSSSAASAKNNPNFERVFAKSKIPDAVPLQKSPAATSLPDPLYVIWPKAALHKTGGVDLLNSKNVIVFEWKGTVNERIQKFKWLNHVGSGTYKISTFLTDPSGKPYDKYLALGYRVMGPAHYLFARFIMPIFTASILTVLGVVFYKRFGFIR